ncbi:MAG: hypothetical protein MMC33_009940 [Icmadophila ericetorum]|nr:hypothetical protein [Icmadophila ericetorum]
MTCRRQGHLLIEGEEDIDPSSPEYQPTEPGSGSSGDEEDRDRISGVASGNEQREAGAELNSLSDRSDLDSDDEGNEPTRHGSPQVNITVARHLPEATFHDAPLQLSANYCWLISAICKATSFAEAEQYTFTGLAAAIKRLRSTGLRQEFVGRVQANGVSVVAAVFFHICLKMWIGQLPREESLATVSCWALACTFVIGVTVEGLSIELLLYWEERLVRQIGWGGNSCGRFRRLSR